MLGTINFVEIFSTFLVMFAIIDITFHTHGFGNFMYFCKV